MKKLYRFVVTFTLAFMLVGCGGSDNQYDGVNGLQTPDDIFIGDVETYLSDIYTQMIQADSADVLAQAEVLVLSIKELNAAPTTEKLQNARDEFKKLVYIYKRVETLYVAGKSSDDMRDIAEFKIEQFIKGSKSQDIAGDLESVFAGTKNIVTNALKGITALEYTLFGNVESASSVAAKMNQKRQDAALLMAENIVVQLNEIDKYYKNNTAFLSDRDAGISALLNVLVDSAFKLREARIGDSAGFTAKYKNNPDSKRLEYYYSTNSLEAIVEILKTHQRVMKGGLKEIATAGNAASEASAILTATEDGLAICERYTGSLESQLSSPKTLELYETIRTLQNNYTALINGLNFQQDLLEADGD